MPRFELALLRSELDRVLREVEARYGPSVETTESLYWALPPGEQVSFDSEPTPSVGDLSDDVSELTALSGRLDSEIVPWHDLRHLVALLELVARRDLPER